MTAVPPTRAGVLGPGGVGGLIAARLAAAGHDVTVIATERTAAALTVHGLELRTPAADEQVTARPQARAWLSEPLDVLFVAVKATDLLVSLERVPAALLDGAAIVPLLNGIDHVPLLRARFPASEVVAATIAVEATRHRPGVVEQLSSFAAIEVAAPRGGPSPGRTVADLLTGAGLDVQVTEDEALVLWRKLALLAPFALLTTAARAPLGEARTQRGQWLAPLVAEATAAAAAAGATLDAAPIEERLGSMPPAMRSSMLKDHEAGRTLELDAIAGPVIRALSAERAPTTVAAVAEILEHRPA